MGHPDAEWRDWQAAWTWDRETPRQPGAEQLRRRVVRHGRRLILITLCEAAITLVALAAVVLLLSERPGAVTTVYAAAVVVLTGAAWAFALWNRRGIWAPAGQTTRAYLELSRLRCVRQIRTARFCAWLLAAEAAFLIPWGVWQAEVEAPRIAAHPVRHLLVWSLVAALIAACAAWSVWFRRRALRGLAHLDRLAVDTSERP